MFGQISQPLLTSRQPPTGSTFWVTFGTPVAPPWYTSPRSRAMSNDSGDTVPYAPVLPGAVDQPPRIHPPSTRPPSTQPPRTRYLDPFALATNHLVRRPSPVIPAPLAPAAEVPPIYSAGPPSPSPPSPRSRSSCRPSIRMEAPWMVSLSCERPNSPGGVRVSPSEQGRAAAHQGVGGSDSGPLGPTRRGAAGSPRTNPLRCSRHSSPR